MDLDAKQLKKLTKDSIKGVVGSEFVKIKSIFVPVVSTKEQKEIEKTHGKPTRNIAKTYSVKV